MYQHQTSIRVRYAETDQMGYVYYGNYATYYEVGRVELIRSLGLSYKELEQRGVMLPVLEYKIKYVKPAFYDTELKVITSIEKLPSTRISFHVKCMNEQGELLNFGEVKLVFVDKNTGKPCEAPSDLLEKLNPYFTKPSSSADKA